MTKSAIIGEIALQDNSATTTAADQQRSIRINGFNDVDKIAPNPAFISNDPSDQDAGVYTLNIPQLGKGRTQIGFKYQLSASASTSTSGQLAPLLLHPQWKIEAGQASVILTYSLNPDFAATSDEVALKDVTLAVHLGEGSKSGACLSKPVGTFNKERGVIYWNLGSVTLKKGESQKLLARFNTEEEAKIGRAEARWTLEGVGSTIGLEVKAKGEEDPFSDGIAEGEWKKIEGEKRRLVAGTYQGS